MNKLTIAICSIFLLATIFVVSCGKESGTMTPPPNPCANKTIVVTGTTTATSTATTSNGTIVASASGSTGFTYSLNGGAAQASGTFSGLAVGNYTITAKDADGCTGSQTFSIVSTPCPSITVTATVTQATGTTSSNGSIVATASGSTGFTYSINAGAFQASGTFNNLAVGSYTIVARDANGCTGTNSFSVTSASCPTITLSTTVTNTSGPSATNGSIIVTVSGGVAPHTFSRDGGATFQSSNTFNNLAAATYTVVAKDANGCLSTSVSTTVGATCPTITANASTTSTVKCESNAGTITIAASGSSGLTYNLNGGSFQTSNTFSALGSGVFSFTVRDANGCSTSGSVTVSQAAAGTRFLAVKSVMANSCISCHGGSSPESGLNFADDCTIVNQASRIKARAVDANPSVMPPGGSISAADKQKIVDWINAGGRYNN
jgi:hypothetical protein